MSETSLDAPSSRQRRRRETHFRRVQVGILIALEYFFALVFNGIPFSALSPHPDQAPSIDPFLLGTFAFIAVLFAILIHTGQGGANLVKARADSGILPPETVIGDRTTDQCWRAGTFYVNPDDPGRIQIGRRFLYR